MSTEDEQTTTKLAKEKERRLQLAAMIRKDAVLPKPARTVGAFLATLCDVAQPYAFASQADMAERFGMSERSVRRAVHDVEARGYFTKKRTGGKRGDGWGRNHYWPVYSVLSDPTGLKWPAAQDAGESSGGPVARPKMAGSKRPEMAGTIGQEWPVLPAKSGRCSGEQVDLGENQGENGKCAAGRTVPVDAAAWGDFLDTFPGRIGRRHNGQTDTEWKPIFDRFLTVKGLPWIKLRASMDQAHVGRPLCSVGHFLQNLEASA